MYTHKALEEIEKMDKTMRELINLRAELVGHSDCLLSLRNRVAREEVVSLGDLHFNWY